MLFCTAPFFVFLAVVLAAFWFSPPAWRKWILLAASYFFYGCWNPKFIPLLWALTAIDYSAALWIQHVESGRRKLILALSLTANLGFLGFFKYYNFLASNLAWAMGKPAGSFFLAIVLPLGISFHTFQSLSYVVDVYRRQQKPIRNLLDYALYIAFFPQLVAGPIVRAREFFRDFYDWRPPDGRGVQRGLLLVVLGLTKKAALADRFALVSDAYFSNIAGHPGMLTAWSGCCAFALQVYFDFSGYSDMAIGMAEFFGIHFPENFRRPFLADCITEFWRRWHMTLSSWLRDYLYFPLGGSRKGRGRTYVNLILTMLLAGLWHGAAWNFVLWGGCQGLLLAGERATGIRPINFRARPVLYSIRALLAFGVFVAGLAVFRAPGLRETGLSLVQMFSGARGASLFNLWQTGLALCALVLAVLEEWLGWFDRLLTGPLWTYAAALTLMLATLEMFSVTEISIPFVYFQF